MNISNIPQWIVALLLITGCAAPQSTPKSEPTDESNAALCTSWSSGEFTVALTANANITAYAPSGQLVTVGTDAQCVYSVSYTQELDKETSEQFTNAAIQACFLPEVRESAHIETMIMSYYVDCSRFSRPEFIMPVEAILLPSNIQVRMWSLKNESLSSVDGALFDPGEIVILLSNTVTEFTIADPDFPEQTYQFAADSVIFSYP